MAEQKIKLTVSQILEDLNNGLDRKAIREKYNLTATDVARLFQHEKLKGVRVRTAPAFELEDDTVDEPVKKAAAKKSAPKAAAQEEAPAVSTATANTTEQEEEVAEQAAAVSEDTTASSGISEVKTEEDEAETKKGLW